ncbi:hypothetical protein DL93DRAFT_2074632 [Clavulina sp. PMI_390]|nr:hypothetical protein DL93DRAFT_2074632 [Clavulina sp. PMI_390]
MEAPSWFKDDLTTCQYGIITSVSHLIVTDKVELSDGLALRTSPTFKTCKSPTNHSELIPRNALPPHRGSFEFPFAPFIATVTALLLFNLPPFTAIPPSVEELSSSLADHDINDKSLLQADVHASNNQDIDGEDETESSLASFTKYRYLIESPRLFLSAPDPTQTVTICSGGSITPGVRVTIDASPPDPAPNLTHTGQNPLAYNSPLDPQLIKDLDSLYELEFPVLCIPDSSDPPRIKVELIKQIGHGISSTVWKTECEGLDWSGDIVLKLYYPEAFDAVVRESFLYEHVFKKDEAASNLVPRYFGTFSGCSGAWFGMLLEDVGEPISKDDDVELEVEQHIQQVLKRVGMEHSDLGARNVLRDSKGALRVIDFGQMDFIGQEDE